MSNGTQTENNGNNTPGEKPWNLQRAKLKLKYPKLTANDLYFKHGEQEAMMVRLREKLGMTEDELQVVLAGL